MTGYALSVTSPSALLAARQAALVRFDRLVRVELAAAAERWAIPAGYSIDQTIYHRLYPRVPNSGGHWLLFGAEDSLDGQTLTTLSVSLEFVADLPAAFHLSGAGDLRADGCSAADLRDALIRCAGPLRQCTLAPITVLNAATTATPSRYPRPIR